MQAGTALVPEFHPAWNSLPTAIWVVLILVIVLLFRSDLKMLLGLLIRRLRLGAGLKVGSFEIGHAYVAPGTTATTSAIHDVQPDAGERRHRQREQYYVPNRQLMLVHRIAPSAKPDQLYDVVLYLVPHPTSDATLVSVKKVAYYFGKSWGRSIFTSADRARSFAIATSAYGPFMCTAEIHFSDGEVVTVARYVDFEMGAVGAEPEPPSTNT